MAGTLRGIAHLQDVELVGGDAVECRLLLLLDCFLQVINSFRKENVNHKGVMIAESENAAEEREFGGHVSNFGARDNNWAQPAVTDSDVTSQDAILVTTTQAVSPPC